MILCIVQARMGSSRLPGKSMLPLNGKPLVEHVVARCKATSLPMDVCVATTDQPEDDVLALHCETLNVRVYRGSSGDVLGRFYFASELYPKADVIIRITADDPFKDPSLIDTVAGLFLAEWATPKGDVPPPQFMCIGGPSWPRGLDVEVFTKEALTNAHKNATDPYDREHVTSYICQNNAAWILKNPTGKGGAHLSWTIDDMAGYSFALKVYDALYEKHPTFGFNEMIDAGYAA